MPRSAASTPDKTPDGGALTAAAVIAGALTGATAADDSVAAAGGAATTTAAAGAGATRPPAAGAATTAAGETAGADTTGAVTASTGAAGTSTAATGAGAVLGSGTLDTAPPPAPTGTATLLDDRSGTASTAVRSTTTDRVLAGRGAAGASLPAFTAPEERAPAEARVRGAGRDPPDDVAPPPDALAAESLPSAHAAAGDTITAVPIPSATANAPTRPTYREADGMA